jgi:hypothetical protein
MRDAIRDLSSRITHPHIRITWHSCPVFALNPEAAYDSRSFATLLLLTGNILASSHAHTKPVGQFDSHEDVSGVATPVPSFTQRARAHTIAASGTILWAGKDEFHYLWSAMKAISFCVPGWSLSGQGVDPHRKIGWIIRPNLDTDAPHVNASVHGDGLTSLQFRRTKGDVTQDMRSAIKAPDVIQLERKGDTYIMSVAHFGEMFTTQETSGVALGDAVYAGMYVRTTTAWLRSCVSRC